MRPSGSTVSAILPSGQERSHRAQDFRGYLFQIPFAEQADRNAVVEFGVQPSEPSLHYGGVIGFLQCSDNAKGEPQPRLGIIVRLRAIHPAIESAHILD